MKAANVMVIATGVTALVILLGSVLIFWLERRKQPEPAPVAGDLTARLKAVIIRRSLVLLGGILLVSLAVGLMVKFTYGLVFMAGAAGVLLVGLLSAFIGMEKSKLVRKVGEDESSAWSEPSIESLALGLILGGVAFLSVWLICFKWASAPILLYFIAGCVLSGLAFRQGGSFMIIGYNAGFARISRALPAPKQSDADSSIAERLAALDHSGLAVEFVVLYISVLALAAGLGIVEPTADYAGKSVLVQIMASFGLLMGFVLLLIMLVKKKGEGLPRLLNRIIIGAMVLICLTGLIVGYFISSPGSADSLWPMLIAVIFVFMIAAAVQYNTSRRYKKVQNISKLSTYGSALVLMGGDALGMGGMIVPLVLLALLAVFAFSAGGGKIVGVGCVLLSTGFLTSLAPLLTAYYFKYEALDTVINGDASGTNRQTRQEIRPPGRKGTFSASLLGSLTIMITGLVLLAGLSLIISEGKDGTLSVVSIFLILAFLLGSALAITVCAVLLSTIRTMIVEVLEEFRTPLREIAKGKQSLTEGLYYLHDRLVVRYSTLYPFITVLLVISVLAFTVLALGADSLPSLMLGFGCTGFCLMLWLENTGSAWISAFKFIQDGNYAEKGSESYRTAQDFAELGLVYRHLLVPALRLLIIFAIYAALLLFHGVVK